jgi:hypothetical protein
MNQGDANLDREQRRIEIRRLGLQAYQVALTLGVFIFIGSVTAHWCYRVVLGYYDIILLTILIRPAIIFFLWLRQRSCRSSAFRLLAIWAMGLTVLSLSRKGSDIFYLLALASLVVISVAACVLWKKTEHHNLFAG